MIKYNNKYVSPVNVVYLKMNQVDHTVLGTVRPCILKVSLLALIILHKNVQKQKGID